ncbi:hypothetical protein FCV25MIE_09540, partial [Fagus crenata]
LSLYRPRSGPELVVDGGAVGLENPPQIEAAPRSKPPQKNKARRWRRLDLGVGVGFA